MRKLAAAAAILVLGGCATAQTDNTNKTNALPAPVTIASLTGPTTMGLVGLMQADESGASAQDYEITVYGTADEVVPKVAQGEVDVALIPANLAAVLYNRTLEDGVGQVQVAAINTLGVLQIVEAGNTINSLDDLRGRTVYSTGKGSSPQWVLEYLLRADGLDPQTDVTIEYLSEAAEVAAMLSQEPGAVGVLPQPYATVITVQNPQVRIALDLTDEWAQVSPESQLVTAVMLVSSDLVENRPEALATLLDEYEESVVFTNENPDEAGVLIAEAGVVPSAALAAAAIPVSHIVFITGDQMRKSLSGYLGVLYEADPESVGGALPDDDFYCAL